MMTFEILPYVHAEHFDAMLALWNAELGLTWPVEREVLSRATRPGDAARDNTEWVGFVAMVGGRAVGFVHAQAGVGGGADAEGAISLVLVASAFRRRGIGSALLGAATEALRSAGVRRATPGGGREYLWPGVPHNLPGARAFFESRGCRWTYTCHDLLQSLADYSTPPDAAQRIATASVAGVVVAPAAVEDRDDVLPFVEREFPEWAEFYAGTAELGDHGDILLARDGAGVVVGALLMYSAWSHPERNDVRWRTLLGTGVGSLGAVGVAEAERGRGIGLALVARGSEVLRERGAGVCFISWVYATEFYAKLGYDPWRTYEAGELVL